MDRRQRTEQRKAQQKMLGAILRDLREQRGISQTKAAGRLGRPQSFVSKVEQGDRRFDYFELRAYCRSLGISFWRVVQAIDEGQ
jgi:transcriptional regulator with XRE-family HTH domain